MKKYYLIVLRNLEMYEERLVADNSLTEGLRSYIERKRNEVTNKLAKL